MHVGNNSSSEARGHVIEQEQHSRVENKPPQSPQGPGDSSRGQAPAPRGHPLHTPAEAGCTGNCLPPCPGSCRPTFQRPPASRVTHSSCFPMGTSQWAGWPDWAPGNLNPCQLLLWFTVRSISLLQVQVPEAWRHCWSSPIVGRDPGLSKVLCWRTPSRAIPNVGDHAQQWTLCIKHGHEGSQNQGIPSPTCAFTGLFPVLAAAKTVGRVEQEPHSPHDTPEKLSKYYIVSILPSKHRKTNPFSYSSLLQ